MEKRIVKVGLGRLDRPMTLDQARRYGDRNMPKGLKAAGFQTDVFVSDPEINGERFYRINYGKSRDTGRYDKLPLY